jgi:hypothetical protein
MIVFSRTINIGKRMLIPIEQISTIRRGEEVGEFKWDWAPVPKV